MNAIIYSKDNCPYCVQAKKLLDSKNIVYQEMIISPGFNEKPLKPNQQYTTREELLEKLPNAKSVPQIWLNSSYIGGYDELSAFFQNQ